MSNVQGKRDVVIILGKTGYGKTTWLNKYAEKFPRIFVFDPFRTFKAEYINADTLIERHESGVLKSTPRFRYGMNLLPDFDLLGAVSFLTGKCCLVIEECGVVFYKGGRIPEWMQEAIFLGRQTELSLIVTAQRATSIPIELRSQANRFVTFRQTEKNDLVWTRDYLGEHYDLLPTLEELECLDSDGKSVSHYRINPMGKS